MRFLRRATARRCLAASLGMVAVLAGACGGTPGGEPDTQAEERKATDAEIRKLGPVTLTVQDYEIESPTRLATYKEIDRAFEREYPNVTVKRVSKTFDEVFQTVKLQLAGNKAPDVLQTNQGTLIADLAKARLIRPLDSYAKDFGWEERQPKSLQDMARASEDGKYILEGTLYGISATADLIGYYYNTEKLEKLGAEVPTSFDDLEAILEEAKRAGEVPLALGLQGGFGAPAAHLHDTLLASVTSADYLRKLIAGREGAFTDEAQLEAAETIRAWVEKGYFTPDFSGVNYQDAWQGFTKGGAVLLTTGSWLAPDIADAMGKNVGFFLPPPNEGSSPTAIGTGGGPWGISAKAEHPEVAAAYLDFLTSARSAERFAKTELPAFVLEDPSGGAEAGTLRADLGEAYAMLADGDAFAPYPDWSTAEMYDVQSTGATAVLAGRMSPQEFVQKLQDAYEKRPSAQ
jgi:raffinose/stachyose/melibiose transport system substrate-binding protein